MLDHVVELLPYVVGVRLPHDVAFFYAPRFAVVAVAHDFVLQPVVLRVYSAGEHQHALRQLHRGAVGIGAVVLTAGQHGVLVDCAAAILPELAQLGVVDDFQLLRVVLGSEKFKNDFLPRRPRGREGVQPEGAHAGGVCLRVLGDPLCRLPPHGFLRYNAAAVRAGPCDRAVYGVDFLPAHLFDGVLIMDPVKYDFAILSALRALVAPALLCALVVAVLNVRGSLYCRG